MSCYVPSVKGDFRELVLSDRGSARLDLYVL